MTGSGTAAILQDLRDILRHAIHFCRTTPNAPEDVQDALLHYSSLYLGIEEIIQLAHRSANSPPTADKDDRLLKQYVCRARTALEEIRSVLAKHRGVLINLRQARWHPVRKKAAFVLEKLSTIMDAINSTALLVAIRLRSTHLGTMLAKLDTLIASCQRLANSQQSTYATGAIGPSMLDANFFPRSVEGRLEQLLKPLNVAFIHDELQTAHSYAIRLAHGQPSQSQVQMLNITLLAGYLENAPSCPPNHVPQMVAFYSRHMVASREGDVRRMSQTMSRASGLQYSFTISNLTPMFFAIESGNVAAVQYLLDIGVGVNDSFGRTSIVPLAAALQFRQLEVTKLLLNAGASFRHRNSAGWSPMTFLWFMPRRNPSASDFLTLLWSSPCFQLLHQGVYDDDGWSVMHRATVYGAAEDIRVLVRYRLDPFSRTKKAKAERDESEYGNFSVLQLAVYYGRVDVVEQLIPYYLQRYGNIDLPDARGWTLLHMAVGEGHIDVARVLVMHGANVNAKTKRTLSDIPGDTKTYRYTPMSLAKSVGPEVYKQVRILRQNALPEPASQMSISSNTSLASTSNTQPQLCGSSPVTNANPISTALIPATTPDSRSLTHNEVTQSSRLTIEARKSFETTTVSGRGRAHLGDVYYVKHYHFPLPRGLIRALNKRRTRRLHRRLSLLDNG